MAEHESRTDVTCGETCGEPAQSEPALSDELRDALTVLRDRSEDDEFRALVDDLLAGRCGLMAAAGTAAFGQAVFARVAQEIAEHPELRCGALALPGCGASPDGPCAGCPGSGAPPGPES
ncbi:MAG TPA: hypothetical protein VFQ77_00195 [Pseudonocardiaceae bacterium]|jgi:hypothetical protein|nr:hypothetical protein [Pseudonocardiaceae bacterium]